MNDVLRQRLNMIGEWLADDANNNGCKLAAVLSALRGPDNMSDSLKEQIAERGVK